MNKTMTTKEAYEQHEKSIYKIVGKATDDIAALLPHEDMGDATEIAGELIFMYLQECGYKPKENNG